MTISNTNQLVSKRQLECKKTTINKIESDKNGRSGWFKIETKQMNQEEHHIQLQLPRWNSWPQWSLAQARSPSLVTDSIQIEHRTEPKALTSSIDSPSELSSVARSLASNSNLVTLLPKPMIKIQSFFRFSSNSK